MTTLLTVALTIQNVQAAKSVSRKETATPKEVATKYFEFLFKTGDFGAVKKIIAPSAVYYQAEGLPYGGTYLGFDKWITTFTKAQTYFDLQIAGEPIYYTSESSAEGVFINFTIKCISKKIKKEIHNYTDNTGLGLYMIKLQMKALGGSVSMRSKVNVGTKFSLI